MAAGVWAALRAPLGRVGLRGPGPTSPRSSTASRYATCVRTRTRRRPPGLDRRSTLARSAGYASTIWVTGPTSSTRAPRTVATGPRSSTTPSTWPARSRRSVVSTGASGAPRAPSARQGWTSFTAGRDTRARSSGPSTRGSGTGFGRRRRPRGSRGPRLTARLSVTATTSKLTRRGRRLLRASRRCAVGPTLAAGCGSFSGGPSPPSAPLPGHLRRSARPVRRAAAVPTPLGTRGSSVGTARGVRRSCRTPPSCEPPWWGSFAVAPASLSARGGRVSLPTTFTSPVALGAAWGALHPRRALGRGAAGLPRLGPGASRSRGTRPAACWF